MSPALLILQLAAQLAAASPPLTTLAERNGYTRTGRYDEVSALCRRFEEAYPGRARARVFGTTPEGRPLYVLAASADGALDPETARRRGRPVVLAQGGIHAGEID